MGYNAGHYSVLFGIIFKFHYSVKTAPCFNLVIILAEWGF